jgi:SOS-response transcriptional repressor LexA
MLTKRQHQALLFICDYVNREGVAPTYYEIADAIGLKSKSGVNRLIQGLAERGYIRFIPNRPRAIEVLREPNHKPSLHIITDEIVDRVALAIEASMFSPDRFPLPPEVHAEFRLTARAAIDAMERYP